MFKMKLIFFKNPQLLISQTVVQLFRPSLKQPISHNPSIYCARARPGINSKMAGGRYSYPYGPNPTEESLKLKVQVDVQTN